MAEKREPNLSPFVPTQWSLVDQAGQTGADARREPLGILVKRYLPALRAHLRVEKRLPPERVEDLLQGFVADKIVEQNLVGRADREKGKFRSFLLVAINRYMIDQFRHESSAKRHLEGDGLLDAEGQANLVSSEAEPSAQFDVAWARELVAEALRRMRVECETSERNELWAVFECRVVRPSFNEAEPISYEMLVEQFGFETPLQVYNLLTTAKRMFARLLRSTVAEYAVEAEMVDQEITDLKSILSRAGI